MNCIIKYCLNDCSHNDDSQVDSWPYNTIYAVVTVRDQDEGENGLADLEITAGDPDGMFRVKPATSRNEFYIEMSPIVAKALDRSSGGPAVHNFNLTLVAADHGVPSKTSQKVAKKMCTLNFL